MQHDLYYAGKVAVVTGAGSGIGKATALLLAKLGCKVALNARNVEKLQETKRKIEEMGGAALLTPGDVSKEEDIKNMYNKVKETWGNQVDIVVANAGINGLWAPIEELPVEEFDKTIGINLRGTFSTIKYAVPMMKEHGGAIVVVSSINGTRAFSKPGATAYSTSKAGQVCLAKMLSLELAKWQIRVNVVCPGRIETNIDKSTVQKDTEGIHIPVEFPEGKIPLNHNTPGTPEQVANVIEFLCSDKASFVTGTEMWIDGGETILRS